MTQISSTGAMKIAKERQRQVEVELYDASTDDVYTDGEMVMAARAYLDVNTQLDVTIPEMQKSVRRTLAIARQRVSTGSIGDLNLLLENLEKKPEMFIERGVWPWGAGGFKPSADRMRNLEKAGALLAAEIDRLERASAREDDDGE